MVPVLDSTKKYSQSEDLGSKNRQANQVYISLSRESRLYLLYIKHIILKKTAMESIKDKLEFENTYVRELMHI